MQAVQLSKEQVDALPESKRDAVQYLVSHFDQFYRSILYLLY